MCGRKRERKRRRIKGRAADKTAPLVHRGTGVLCVCVCVWNKRRPTVGTPRTPSFSPNFPTLAATTTPESSIGSSFRISIVSSQQLHNGSGGRAFNFTDPFDQSPCWINMGCGWSVYRVSASYHHWSRGRNFGKREGRPKSLGNRHGAATTAGGFSSSSTKCRPSVVSCVCVDSFIPRWLVPDAGAEWNRKTHARRVGGVDPLLLLLEPFTAARTPIHQPKKPLPTGEEKTRKSDWKRSRSG